MKKLILILLLPLATRAQKPLPANIDSFSFVYTGIQQVPGVSAKILQSRARWFIAYTYQNPHDITRYDDTDGGLLTNKVPADRFMDKSDWELARISGRAYIQEFLDQFNAALQSDDLDPDKSDF
jgi:hypothetical protein